jgi:hypothetical protein
MLEVEIINRLEVRWFLFCPKNHFIICNNRWVLFGSFAALLNMDPNSKEAAIFEQGGSTAVTPGKLIFSNLIYFLFLWLIYAINKYRQNKSVIIKFG